ncbi:MAG: XRE family transcriptional regulator, partial [Flavobacterium sp.]
NSPAPSTENFAGEDLFSQIEYKAENPQTKKIELNKNSNLNVEEDEIEKIVFFYKNGTFKVYTP